MLELAADRLVGGGWLSGWRPLIGVTVELPAAVYEVTLLGRCLLFLSVGARDLAQSALVQIDSGATS